MSTATEPQEAPLVMDRARAIEDKQIGPYRKLVLLYASGKEATDADVVVSTVRAVGKNLDQFHVDVERVRKRVAAVGSIAEAQTKGPEFAVARKVLQETQEEWESISRGGKQLSEPEVSDAALVMEKALREARALGSEIRSLRADATKVLLATCDPSISAAIVVKNKSRQELASKLPNMKAGLGNREAAAKKAAAWRLQFKAWKKGEPYRDRHGYATEWLPADGHRSGDKKVRAAADATIRKLEAWANPDEVKKRIAELEEQIATLSGEIAVLQESRLVPENMVWD